jgi:hypothetical protein
MKKIDSLFGQTMRAVDEAGTKFCTSWNYSDCYRGDAATKFEFWGCL